LPLEAFNKNSTRKDGLQSMCRECWKIYYKENYYLRGKEKERLRNNRVKNYRVFADLVKGAKDVPCIDCGVKYPPHVMQFDHLPEHEKKFTIANSARFHSLKKIKEEILKCEVVCANCHAIRTWERANGVTV
jgi:hypothetical protein